MSLPVVGGRFDGATVGAPTTPRPWGWVGHHGRGYRLHVAPGVDRELYRLASGRYVAAEHTHAVCPDCGGLTATAACCHGCGAALA